MERCQWYGCTNEIKDGERLFLDFHHFGKLCRDCFETQVETDFEWHKCTECGKNTHRYLSALRKVRGREKVEYICIHCYMKKYTCIVGTKEYYKEYGE